MLPIPSDEEIAAMSPEDLLLVHQTREEAIKNSRQDPYNYGWVFNNWREVQQSFETNDEILVSGGNRASKTRVGSYFVVKAAVENPGSMIFCFCQTAENSIRDQQAAVWEYLPQEYKTKQMSGTAKKAGEGLEGDDWIPLQLRRGVVILPASPAAPAKISVNPAVPAPVSTMFRLTNRSPVDPIPLVRASSTEVVNPCIPPPAICLIVEADFSLRL